MWPGVAIPKRSPTPMVHLLESRETGAVKGNSFRKTTAFSWVSGASFIFSTDLHRSDGVKIIRKIVKTLPEVTAVLTANLEMAQGVRSELSVLGKRVPDDISIIPLDMVNDSAGNRDFTAVGANFSDAGVAAARMLLERIQEQERGDKRINIVKKVILEPQVFAGGKVRDQRTE